MTTISLARGETSSIQVTVKAADVAKLPAECKFIFTAKKNLDSDIKDASAIIQKIYDYPGDFTGATDKVIYIPITMTDTTKTPGLYVCDFRFLKEDKTVSKNTTKFDIEIILTPTQLQEV